MSKVALITGITGQDGSYLAEFLLEKGYEVHGIVRRASISNTARIDHLVEKNVIKLHDGDLSDSSGLIRLVGEIRPDEIYNLAAQSHVQVSFDAPEYSGDVDTGCLSIQNADRRCITVRTGWHFGYYCAWMAVARYPMMRELLIFIRETVCLCRRIQKSLRFTDRRSSLISEDKIQNSRVWGKTGR